MFKFVFDVDPERNEINLVLKILFANKLIRKPVVQYSNMHLNSIFNFFNSKNGMAWNISETLVIFTESRNTTFQTERKRGENFATSATAY